MNKWVEFYLEDERKTNLEKGTAEQRVKIKSLVADLDELLKSDNIDARDSNQIVGHFDAYVATLSAYKDEKGDMDLEALSYLQSKNFIDILLECLVYSRASIKRKWYSRYQTSLVEIEQKIKNYKHKAKL